MSRAAWSVFIWGLVITGAGLLLLLFPDFTAGIYGMDAPIDGWARLTGAFMVWLGIYYVVCARSNAIAFFRATVIIRPTVLLTFIVLVAMGQFKPGVIFVGTMDTLTAIWTAWALRADARKVSMA